MPDGLSYPPAINILTPTSYSPGRLPNVSMKTTKRSYQAEPNYCAENTKVEPLQPPDKPKAPKKTTSELMLDKAETKTEAETKAKNKVETKDGTTKSSRLTKQTPRSMPSQTRWHRQSTPRTGGPATIGTLDLAERMKVTPSQLTMEPKKLNWPMLGPKSTPSRTR